MAANCANNQCPWKDGSFQCFWSGKAMGNVRIKGMDFFFEQFGMSNDEEKEPNVEVALGTFEGVDKRGLTKTGLESYAIKLTFPKMGNYVTYSNVVENGTKFVQESGDTWELIDEEALKKLEDEKDPWDCYSHFYELHPENQGKIIWITGGTGTGKSTTAANLLKKHGYVCYEGDTLIMSANPYVGNSPSGPSVWGTKLLRGVPEDRTKRGQILLEAYGKLAEKKEYELSEFNNFYDDLCKDVLKEKAKIGGNWVVCQAVYLRTCRDFIREKLGDQCVFIILKMVPELQIKRLAKRMLGDSGEITEEAMEKAREVFKTLKHTEGFQEMEDDEPNSFTINIDETMDVDAVTDSIVEAITN